MYKETGNISVEDNKFLLNVAKAATWKVVKGSGRDYLTSFCGDDVKDLFDWDNWQSAFFLKVPSGGTIHSHIDVLHPWNSYHVIVKTNTKAVSYWQDGLGEHSFKPKVRNVYKVNRSLKHWAENNGKTDRIHLLCEVYE